MQADDQISTVLVNGETSAEVSVRDRGLQYGHGLFETIAIKDGKAEYWDQHIVRLTAGCLRLGIKRPDPSQLLQEATKLLSDSNKERAVLKIIYTCGEGGRGYKTPDQISPTRILSLTDWPQYSDENYQSGVTIRLCDTRLSINPSLAGLKHLNRLESVLARSEWDDLEIAEGLMLDTQGHVREATMSNVFFVKDNILCTPDITRSGVAGIMRNVVLQLAENLNIKTYIDDFTPEDFIQADEVFLTNCLIGIWPVQKLILDEPMNYDKEKLITRNLMKNRDAS